MRIFLITKLHYTKGFSLNVEVTPGKSLHLGKLLYLQLIQKFPGISGKSKSHCPFYTSPPMVTYHRNPLSIIPYSSFKVKLLSLSQSNCEEELASSHQSVCLSDRMQESDSHQVEFREISCVEFLLEFVDSF